MRLGELQALMWSEIKNDHISAITISEHFRETLNNIFNSHRGNKGNMIQTLENYHLTLFMKYFLINKHSFYLKTREDVRETEEN